MDKKRKRILCKGDAYTMDLGIIWSVGLMRLFINSSISMESRAVDLDLRLP